MDSVYRSLHRIMLSLTLIAAIIQSSICAILNFFPDPGLSCREGELMLLEQKRTARNSLYNDLPNFS